MVYPCINAASSESNINRQFNDVQVKEENFVLYSFRTCWSNREGKLAATPELRDGSWDLDMYPRFSILYPASFILCWYCECTLIRSVPLPRGPRLSAAAGGQPSLESLSQYPSVAVLLVKELVLAPSMTLSTLCIRVVAAPSSCPLLKKA